MVTYDNTNTSYSISNRRSRRVVLDRRSDGDLRRRNNPYRNNGGSAGSRQVGDCSMVAPELEESILVDEVLSNISSAGIDGNHVSGHLRISIEGALRALDQYGREQRPCD